MAPIIPLLIQLMPSIAKMFDAPDTVQAIADQATEIAKVVTGTETPLEAVTMLVNDGEARKKFELAIQEKRLDWEKLYLSDMANARQRDVEIVKATGKSNMRADAMVWLAYAIVGGLLYYVFTDESINEYARGIVTLVLGRFLGYIDQVFSFEFGTTRISRTKDDTINTLSKS